MNQAQPRGDGREARSRRSGRRGPDSAKGRSAREAVAALERAEELQAIIGSWAALLEKALGIWRKIAADPNGLGDETPAARRIRALESDWELDVRVCRPYRARTKGQTESGVGYVKSNAIAGLEFDSFSALEGT